MIPFTQLIVSPTSAAVRAEFVTALITMGIRADLWRPGGVASSLLTVTANIVAGGLGIVSTAIGAAFLPLSSGPWLVLLAYYVYGVTAQAATFAQGNLTLTNSTGSPISKGARQITFSNPITNVTYQNVNPVTVSGGQTLTGVLFEATIAGSAGSSGPASITNLVTPIAGLSGTNPGPIVGLDADSDALVRQKCLARLAARSYLGPNGSYYNAIFVARNAGQPLNINRVNVYTDPNTGQVFVVIASPNGAPSSSDVAAAQVSVNQVAQPMGVVATIVAATVQTFTNPITLWATGAGTVDPATIQAAASAALAAYCASYPIGGLTRPPSTQGYLYASLIDAALASGSSSIYDVQGNTADVALSQNAVPVYTGTITVRQVGGIAA